jgi:hypothetical protein
VQKAIFNKKLTTAQISALELYSRIHEIEKTAVGVAVSRASAKNHGHKAEPEVSATTTARQVPADAVAVWKNRDGEIIGYRDASGKDVQL